MVVRNQLTATEIKIRGVLLQTWRGSQKKKEKMLGFMKLKKREPKEGWTWLLLLLRAFCCHSPRRRQRWSRSSGACLVWGCRRRRRGRRDGGRRGGKGGHRGWWCGRRPGGGRRIRGNLDRGRGGVKKWNRKVRNERGEWEIKINNTPKMIL